MYRVYVRKSTHEPGREKLAIECPSYDVAMRTAKRQLDFYVVTVKKDNEVIATRLVGEKRFTWFIPRAMRV